MKLILSLMMLFSTQTFSAGLTEAEKKVLDQLRPIEDSRRVVCRVSLFENAITAKVGERRRRVHGSYHCGRLNKKTGYIIRPAGISRSDLEVSLISRMEYQDYTTVSIVGDVEGHKVFFFVKR